MLKFPRVLPSYAYRDPAEFVRFARPNLTVAPQGVTRSGDCGVSGTVEPVGYDPVFGLSRTGSDAEQVPADAAAYCGGRYFRRPRSVPVIITKGTR